MKTMDEKARFTEQQANSRASGSHPSSHRFFRFMIRSESGSSTLAGTIWSSQTSGGSGWMGSHGGSCFPDKGRGEGAKLESEQNDEQETTASPSSFAPPRLATCHRVLAAIFSLPLELQG